MTDRPLGPLVPNWTPPPLPEPSVLQGQWARVEPLSAARHGHALFEALVGHDWVFDYLFEEPFTRAEDYLAYVTEAAARSGFRFVALCHADGTPFGLASYMRMDPAAGSIEVGNICIAPIGHGTRAATETMYLMMKWAFDAGYRRYEWKCNALNAPSRRAAQRFGFSYEGLFRKAVIVKGRNRDTAWFAITEDEWPGLQAAYDTWLAPENFDSEGTQRQRLSTLTAPHLVNRDPSL